MRRTKRRDFLKFMGKTVVSIPLSGSLSASQPAGEGHDVVIKGAQVFDGSGAKAFVADIAIKDGRIAEIGKFTGSARTSIDAAGMCAAPGFIDIHTHCDEQFFKAERPFAANYLTQGVTTVVTGNCGYGHSDVRTYFGRLKQKGIELNTLHLVGHGFIRNQVMGAEDRAPTPEAFAEMKGILTEAMEAGAKGLSTGLFYAPGCYAKTEEIIELCRVVRRYNGIYATHMRDEDSHTVGLLAAVAEAIEIGEKADIALQISHIKAVGKSLWGRAAEVCGMIEEAQRRGVKVYADQYPYVASNTNLVSAVIPHWAQAGGELRSRLKGRKDRLRIKAEIAGNIERRGGPEKLVIAYFAQKKDYEGKSLAEISEIRGKPAAETVVELILEGNPSVISFCMSDADVEHFMGKGWVVTASDAMVLNFGEGSPHPRGYGTFPRKLRRYVLEKQIISMPQCIRSCTSLPAQLLGLKDRGLLKKGCAADVIVFNPKTIRDKATFADPHHYSEGVEYVFINGVAAVEKGRCTHTLAGEVLTGSS